VTEGFVHCCEQGNFSPLKENAVNSCLQQIQLRQNPA
jgi:hypothetical protein